MLEIRQFDLYNYMCESSRNEPSNIVRFQEWKETRTINHHAKQNTKERVY